MSITTRTGDAGTTGLMYNRRVSKTHPRIEACGCIDELNAAVGLARASATDPWIGERLLLVQKDLITIMGELATLSEDLPRYASDGFTVVDSPMYAPLEEWIKAVEAQKVSFRGWATPGANLAAATLDMARTVCRRAERRVQDLAESADVQNPHILIYLNRLSDCLWLFARLAER